MDETGSHVATLLLSAPRAYAAGTVDRLAAARPELLTECARRGLGDPAGDTEHRLHHLAEALAAGRPAVLDDHVAWHKVALAARDAPDDYLPANLSCMRDELRESLPSALGTMAASYVDQAARHLAAAPRSLPSLLADGAPHVDLARRFLLATLEGRRDDAVALMIEALARGVSPRELLEHVVLRAQAEIGRMWQMDEIHVAEEHLTSRVVERVLATLAERAPRAARNGRRVLVTTVGGDLHDIGARLVADQLEAAGFETLFLGASVPSADLLRAIPDFAVELIALSANLATHIRTTAQLIAAIRATPECNRVPILIGGGPFQRIPDLWQVVGADGRAHDAFAAPEAARELLAIT
jgi:methanogenic corrinoid protein MtbC1